MKPIKILVAEDEETIREFIVINLKRAGYEVVEAVDGLDAYEKYTLDPEGISIAVLDIMMPRMDGLELCKKLRALSNNIGIMMLTAKTQEMDKVNGLLLGADDYVAKPFSPSEFTARVDALARRVSSSSKRETRRTTKMLFPPASLDWTAKAARLPAAEKRSMLHRLNFRFLNISSAIREKIQQNRYSQSCLGYRIFRRGKNC